MVSSSNATGQDARVAVTASRPELVEYWALEPLSFLKGWQGSEEAQAPLEKLEEDGVGERQKPKDLQKRGSVLGLGWFLF